MTTSNHEFEQTVVNPYRDGPLTDHAYDGIAEYDNPLPRWWVWIFWGTFYFSLAYIIHYHLTGNGSSIAASYDDDVRLAREADAARALGGGEITEEAISRLMNDSGLMTDAQATFTRYCTQCHGPNGQGNIGPNLTDGYWIHSQGDLMGMFKTVSAGVPSKGMPAWERQLRPVELAKVVAYVGTLRGKNLPGKPPEGKLIDNANH